MALRILTGHPKQGKYNVDGLVNNLSKPGGERGSNPAWVLSDAGAQAGPRVAETPLSHRSLMRASFLGILLADPRCGVLGSLTPLWLMEAVSPPAKYPLTWIWGSVLLTSIHQASVLACVR